jgi:hypothetical protein
MLEESLDVQTDDTRQAPDHQRLGWPVLGLYTCIHTPGVRAIAPHSHNQQAPLQPAQAPFPKPSPQGSAEALRSPILRRRSSPSESRAAPRPWARGKSRGRPVAAGGGAGGLEGVLPRCRARGRRKRPFKLPSMWPLWSSPLASVFLPGMLWALGSIAPLGLAASWGAQTAPRPRPAPRAGLDTVHRGGHCPTAEMPEPTCDVRGESVCVPLLGLTVEDARDGATRGHRRGAVMTPRIPHHASPDRPPPVWRPRLAPLDDVRCKGIRCLRRGGLRASSGGLNPIGRSDLRALLPRIPPTLGPAPLPAAHRPGGTGPVTRQRLWTAPRKGCRHRGRLPPLLLTCSTTMCSRGHGPRRA